MSYLPGPPSVHMPMVSATGPWSAATDVFSASLPSSATSYTNGAIYHPIVVPVTVVLRRFWWANGSSVSASYNIDAGIYTDAGYAPGAKIISTGSTAQGTASEVQFVDVTDTVLAPGPYWLALSMSSSSATIFRLSIAGQIDKFAFFEESSAFPLPATATPATMELSKAYLFGFATTASP